MKTLNVNVLNRLDNWKFNQAVNALDGSEPDGIAETIRALARMFGDVGWHMSGDMELIVDHVVTMLLAGGMLDCDLESPNPLDIDNARHSGVVPE